MSSPITAEAAVSSGARLRIHTLGRRAQRAAAGPDAEVIARFEHSAYIRAANGQLACVGGDGLGLGPLNALATTAEFERAGPAVGARVRLDTAAATLWQPRQLVGAAASIPAALGSLKAALEEVPPRGLIGALGDDPTAVRAHKGLAALTAWIAADGGGLPDAVARLIGLGPGLTPAGDDALGGAMIALRAVGRSGPADRLAAQILPLAVTRTSAISIAHLEAAAAGEGAAALHDTLAALTDGDRAASVDGLRRLDRIGHSSGWDALAGAAAALRGLT